jgi:hypothetical protein
MKVPLHAVLVASLAYAPSAFAEDGTESELRCGTHLIEDGVAKVDVLAWCGEPAAKEDSQWIYRRSTVQPDIAVHFGADDTVNQIIAIDQD